MSLFPFTLQVNPKKHKRADEEDDKFSSTETETAENSSDEFVQPAPPKKQKTLGLAKATKPDNKEKAKPKADEEDKEKTDEKEKAKAGGKGKAKKKAAAKPKTKPAAKKKSSDSDEEQEPPKASSRVRKARKKYDA